MGQTVVLLKCAHGDDRPSGEVSQEVEADFLKLVYLVDRGKIEEGQHSQQGYCYSCCEEEDSPYDCSTPGILGGSIKKALCLLVEVIIFAFSLLLDVLLMKCCCISL